MSSQLEIDFASPAPGRGKRKTDEARLPRDETERGYETLRAEHAQALRTLEERFGVVLNRRVRVTLSGIDDEFSGKLVLDQLFHPASRRESLRLRIGTVSFDHTDIESCTVLPA